MGAIFRGEYNDNDMKRFDQVKNAMISDMLRMFSLASPAA